MAKADSVTEAILEIRWIREDGDVEVLFLNGHYSGAAIKATAGGWYITRSGFPRSENLDDAKRALLRYHGIGA